MIIWVIFQLPFGILYFLPKEDTSEYISQVISLSLIGAVSILICGMNFKLFYLAKTLRQRMDISLRSLDGSKHRYTESRKSIGTLAGLTKKSTCLLAVVCLFICYTPSIVVIGLKLSSKANKGESEYMDMLNLWAETFCTINSSLNCLIFFYKNSALRRHAMNLLRKYVSSAKARLHC